MPTGYTYTLLEKKGMTFAEFAMLCARNFGALITMRDEPMDAPIPDEFKPSDYHNKELAKARIELATWRSWTMEEKHSWAEAERKSQADQFRESAAKEEAENAVFDAMAEQVKAWTPPTHDHDGMKEFMLDQLAISRHDGSFFQERIAKIEATPVIDMIRDREESLVRDVAYHTEQLNNESECCASRTAWIRELRKSLEVAQ